MAQRRKTVVRPPLDLDPVEEMLGDPEEVPDSEVSFETGSPLVSTGDVISAKVTIEADLGSKRNVHTWGMFEMRSRVMDGETEEMAAERVIGIVNTRVMDLLGDLDERI